MEITTEDGYTFYVLENGQVADSRVAGSVDMSYDSLVEFLREVDADFVFRGAGYEFECTICTSELAPAAPMQIDVKDDYTFYVRDDGTVSDSLQGSGDYNWDSLDDFLYDHHVELVISGDGFTIEFEPI